MNFPQFEGLLGSVTLSDFVERIKRLKSEITKIDKDMSKLIDKLIETDNVVIAKKIEIKVEKMEQNKLAIVQKCTNLGKPKRGYSEMF